MVDGYFDAVQSLDEQIENLEGDLFETRSDQEATQRRAFEVRKSLVKLRRVILPMREVVNSLLRRDLHILREEMDLCFQDVSDHVLRATEWTEATRWSSRWSRRAATKAIGAQSERALGRRSIAHSMRSRLNERMVGGLKSQYGSSRARTSCSRLRPAPTWGPIWRRCCWRSRKSKRGAGAELGLQAAGPLACY